MINVTMGLDRAKEGYRPYANLDAAELGTDEELHARCEELGIETQVVSTEGAKKLGKEPEPAERATLEARMKDFLKYRELSGLRELQIGIPHDDLLTAMREIVGPGGLWTAHAFADQRPLWIESSSPGLLSLLQEHFAKADAKTGKKEPCPGERPKDWKPVHGPQPMPTTAEAPAPKKK
jgi:hypothetical protein